MLVKIKCCKCARNFKEDVDIDEHIDGEKILEYPLICRHCQDSIYIDIEFTPVVTVFS